MANGVTRQISGEVSQGKKKGSALKQAIGTAFSPAAIANTKPKTQKG